MDRNTPFEDYLDDWVKGVISYEELEQHAQQHGIEDLEELSMLHRAAYNGLRDFQLMQRIAFAQETMTGTNEPIETEKVPVRRMIPYKKWLSVAASIVVLIGLYFTIDTALMSSGKLASSFYNEYYLVNERSETGSNAHTITGSFVRKDYRRVTEQFEAMTASGQREKFLAAFSWYKLENYDKASRLFENIITVNKTLTVPLYDDEATYFLALSYLQQKQYDKAYTLLKHISRNKNHTYYQTVAPSSLSRLWVKKTFS